MLQKKAAELHARSIVIDAVCPFINNRDHIGEYVAGGVTLAIPTVSSVESARETMNLIGRWKRIVAEDDRLIEVNSVAEIEKLKSLGKMGILYHMQGTDPIEDNLDLVYVYRDLGVRIIQLCYNVKNHVGDGADERTDSGLSNFGVKLVRRLNEAKVIVDCSHTGYRTTMDAIEFSQAPVIVSHGNPKAVQPSKRNIGDDVIKAIARSGGIIGAVGFPAFVDSVPNPTLDRFIDHIAYVADLVGIDHVTLGIDYYDGQHPFAPADKAKRIYEEAIRTGVWRGDTYPPPPHHYPDGISVPSKLPNLTARLLERGFKEEDVVKILGANCLRVYRAVWGA